MPACDVKGVIVMNSHRYITWLDSSVLASFSSLFCCYCCCDSLSQLSSASLWQTDKVSICLVNIMDPQLVARDVGTKNRAERRANTDLTFAHVRNINFFSWELVTFPLSGQNNLLIPVEGINVALWQPLFIPEAKCLLNTKEGLAQTSVRFTLMCWT